MNSPKISVIITCYNQEDYISQAIQSVLDQSYTNWECIIVDDGSDDTSVAEIEKFCKIDERVNLVIQPNQGVSKARNNGFIRAKGEYIQFLDGDDYLIQNKLKFQIDHLIRTNADICYSNVTYLYQAKSFYESYPISYINEDPLLEFLFKWGNGINIPIHSALFKRNLWKHEELPFPIDYDGRHEDWVFWIHLCLGDPVFCMTEEELAVYRIHDQAYTSDSLRTSSDKISAAFHISSIIPELQRKIFLQTIIPNLLTEYKEACLFDEVYSTFRWRIGKKLGRFLYPLVPFRIKKKYKIQSL